MNELSRMERHRRKGKKQEPPKPPAVEHGENPGEGVSSSLAEDVDVVSGKPLQVNRVGLSRVNRYRNGTKGDQEHVNREDAPGETVPSRKSSYQSYRVRVSKMFVNSLIIIFVLLMAGLLWWGLIGAPPLKELL